MQPITREKLREKIDRGEEFALIEVLPKSSFDSFHIPGALNAPLDNQFAQRIEGMVPDKERPIVVYCTNEECNASPTAAQKLDELGYRQVFDYEGGKEDWMAAGLPVEPS